MAHVVFMRAVNVGGHQTFKPSELAKSMSKLGVVSVGAAGTFVVKNGGTPAAVAAEFKRRLRFKPELMIQSGAKLKALIAEDPFGRAPEGGGLKRFVTVLARAPAKRPTLPLERPPGGPWKVRVVRVEGPFVLSLYRRVDERPLYPNEVVEREFGVAATTRGWETLEKVAAVLDAPDAKA